MSEDNNTTTTNNNETNSVFSEQDKELASKAKHEYEAGQFDGMLCRSPKEQDLIRNFFSVCLKTLQKILESYPDDPKVLFNIALTEYSMSNYQKTEIFKAQLNKIAEKVNFHFRLGEKLLNFFSLAQLRIRRCYNFGRTRSMYSIL